MSAGTDLLIVDDEPHFAEFVETVAGELGFTTRIAACGDEMRQAYQERVPDIIVMDVVMPGEDGVELTRWLVEHGFAGRLLLTTGYNPLYAKMASILGAFHGGMTVTTLNKPVRLAQLRETLLSRQSPGDRSASLSG